MVGVLGIVQNNIDTPQNDQLRIQESRTLRGTPEGTLHIGSQIHVVAVNERIGEIMRLEGVNGPAAHRAARQMSAPNIKRCAQHAVAPYAQGSVFLTRLQ